MSISVNMFDTASIERRRTTNNTVNFITFFQQKLDQVRTILTSDTCQIIKKKKKKSFSFLMTTNMLYPSGFNQIFLNLPVIRATLRVLYSSTDMLEKAFIFEVNPSAMIYIYIYFLYFFREKG